MKKLHLLPIFALLLTIGLAIGCKDDPPGDPGPTPANFAVNFAVKWGINDLALSQVHIGPDGRHYQIDALKYYVCELSLIKPDNSLEQVKDVALVDLHKPASKTISGDVAAGSYTGIRFGIGLDSAKNHTDPSSYPIEHAMSTTKGMFWTWFTQYIFAKIEGYADTTGGFAAQTFLYHTGIDSLYRELEFTNMNIVIAEGESKSEGLTVDMQKLIFGDTDTIVVATENFTHTTDDVPLAVKVTDNFVKAIRR